MSGPSVDLQRNLVGIVLAIVGLIQGLVFSKIAETIAQFITSKPFDGSITNFLALALLFSVFLRIFQTFVVGAIGYERSEIEAIEIFGLLMLLFIVGTLEYVLINLYILKLWIWVYRVLATLCLLAATSYGWLSFRAVRFSQLDPPSALRDRKLQIINTLFATVEGGLCATLALGASSWMEDLFLLTVTLLLLTNIYVSIKMSFYPAPRSSSGSPWRSWIGDFARELSVWLRPGGVVRIAAEVILLYLLPPFLLWTGFIDFQWRMHVLVVVGIIIFTLALIDGSIDLRIKSAREYLISFAANLTLIAIFAGAASAYRILATTSTSTASSPAAMFVIFYIFLSAPLQEFAYRYRLRTIFHRAHPAVYVVASAVLYSWAHVIYADVTILAGTAVLGLAWASIFVRTGELWGIIAGHAAVGMIAFLANMA